MTRALLGAALLLSGCSLIVSLDGLSGGAASDGEPEGGTSKSPDAKAPSVIVGSEAGPEAGPIVIDETASAYAKAVLTDTPSIYLRFGETAGTKPVKNEIGPLDATYPLDIVLGTPGAIAGDPDTAITFKGGILELPQGQECSGTSECVLELWIRIEEIQNAYGWIVDHELFGPRSGWLLQTLDGDLTYERWSNETGVGAVYNEVKITPKEWHHVAAVSDATGERMYYDGELRQHHPVTNAIPPTNTKWTVGGTACFTCGDRSNYKGSVDELAVYEHSLSEERIKAHYAIGKGN